MSNLSFYEKSAWGTLIVLALLGGMYFQNVIALWRADQLIGPSVTSMAVIFTVILVAALVSFHALIAIIDQPGDEDERDSQIGRRAAYWSGHAMGFGVFAVIFQILFATTFDRPDLYSPFIIVQALIAVVFLAELLDLTLRIVYYRRGL